MNPDAEFQPPFAEFMGMKITHVSKDKVVAEMPCARSTTTASARCMAAR